MKVPLSKSEEELMNLLWRFERAQMRELMDAYPNPKPAATTIATLLKRMHDKGYIAFDTKGRSRVYYALVAKSEYFATHIHTMIKDFFDDSVGQFASFFTQATNLTEDQLRELREIIDKELSKK